MLSRNLTASEPWPSASSSVILKLMAGIFGPSAGVTRSVAADSPDTRPPSRRARGLLVVLVLLRRQQYQLRQHHLAGLVFLVPRLLQRLDLVLGQVRYPVEFVLQQALRLQFPHLVRQVLCPVLLGPALSVPARSLGVSVCVGMWSSRLLNEQAAPRMPGEPQRCFGPFIDPTNSPCGQGEAPSRPGR